MTLFSGLLGCAHVYYVHHRPHCIACIQILSHWLTMNLKCMITLQDQIGYAFNFFGSTMFSGFTVNIGGYKQDFK